MRRVQRTGEIQWRGDEFYVGESFAGEPVGIAESDHGLHLVRFCHVDLGIIDPHGCFRLLTRRQGGRQGWALRQSVPTDQSLHRFRHADRSDR